MAGESPSILRLRLFHLSYKLACISAKRFNIATLPLRINRIKREGGLSRAADTGQCRHFSMWNIDVNVFEVVFRGTLYCNCCACFLLLSKGVCKFGFHEPLLCLAPNVKITAKCLSGVRFGYLSNLFRHTDGDDSTATNTAFWS